MKKTKKILLSFFLLGMIHPIALSAQSARVIDGGCTDNRLLKILSGEKKRSNENEQFEIRKKLLSPQKASFETSTQKGGKNKTYVIEITPNRDYTRRFKSGECLCKLKLSGKVTIYEKGKPSKKGTTDIISGVVRPQNDSWPWDYGAYAACFYASWAGGADIVEAGDTCKEDWLD